MMKKATVILFSCLIAEFVLTLSRNRFYIGLFIFVVCLVIMIAWGVAYDLSVSTNLAARVFLLPTQRERGKKDPSFPLG